MVSLYHDKENAFRFPFHFKILYWQLGLNTNSPIGTRTDKLKDSGSWNKIALWYRLIDLSHQIQNSLFKLNRR